MKKYVVLYMIPPGARDWSETTPEQREEGMKPWMEWQDRMGENLVEMGSPLMPGTEIKTDGSADGIDNHIAGYSIIQAENAEEARALMKNHPHLSWNETCSVVLHEVGMM